MKPSDKPKKDARKPQEGNGQKLIEITPLRLLGIILKAVLQDRITDEEVEKICSVYYKTLEEWWG
jgi:hypothetical protein